MVTRNPGQLKAPAKPGIGAAPSAASRPSRESAAWRPSRERDRLSPVILIAGGVLAGAVIVLMAVLFGVA